MQSPRVVKIEGFKVFFSDGETVRKDPNNIWIYHAFLEHESSPWENRIWIKDENGRIDLYFPSLSEINTSTENDRGIFDDSMRSRL